jgi:hypothetical protein
MGVEAGRAEREVARAVLAAVANADLAKEVEEGGAELEELLEIREAWEATSR